MRSTHFAFRKPRFPTFSPVSVNASLPTLNRVRAWIKLDYPLESKFYEDIGGSIPGDLHDRASASGASTKQKPFSTRSYFSPALGWHSFYRPIRQW